MYYEIPALNNGKLLIEDDSLSFSFEGKDPFVFNEVGIGQAFVEQVDSFRQDTFFPAIDRYCDGGLFICRADFHGKVAPSFTRETLETAQGITFAPSQPLPVEELVRCQKCNALIETTVHCDNCGTFEPTRR